MGRWTQNYTDEVLVTKVANIINGALKRAKDKPDENTKLPISYETFVESLDDKDEFTTKLVEILLKEITDRRSRPVSADRTQIATRTSESLRELARSPPYRVPRFLHLATHPGGDAHGSSYESSDLLEEDEGDDFGMADGMGNMEGARIDSGLYDMYNTRVVAPAGMGPRTGWPMASEGFRPEDRLTLPMPLPNRLPTYFSAFPTHPAASNVAAHAHIHGYRHRPVRARRVTGRTGNGPEFSDFTSRRRTQRRTSSRQEAAADREANDRTPRPSDATPAAPLPRASLFEPPSPQPNEAGSSNSRSPSPLLESDEAYRQMLLAGYGHTHTINYNMPGFAFGTRPGDDYRYWTPNRLPGYPPHAPRIPYRNPEELGLTQGHPAPVSPDVLSTEAVRRVGASQPMPPLPSFPSLVQPEPHWRPSAVRARLPRPPVADFVVDGPLSLPTPRSVSPPEQPLQSSVASSSTAPQ